MANLRLFGSDTCPQCTTVKKYLESIGAAFSYTNVFKSAGAQKLLEKLGVSTVPVLYNSKTERFTVGFDVKKIADVIKEDR